MSLDFEIYDNLLILAYQSFTLVYDLKTYALLKIIEHDLSTMCIKRFNKNFLVAMDSEFIEIYNLPQMNRIY
jgi:hypothetical protein